jgi:glucose-1-phosphate cytidylyltransferase
VKTVILAGGFGTRLAEETTVRPKPMVEIGGKPIVWHIMNIYAAAGHEEFILALGYKGEVIKEYFRSCFAFDSDVSVTPGRTAASIPGGRQPTWQVHLVDTGLNTQTGGRIKRLQRLLAGETFFATYGDGLADIDVGDLLRFHRAHGKIATVTAVHPPARFGEMCLDGGRVVNFAEKPRPVDHWINGGFFVFEPEIFDYIAGDDVALEREPMETLADEGQLFAYRLEAFWQPMDTLRDRSLLEHLWQTHQAPWSQRAAPARVAA